MKEFPMAWRKKFCRQFFGSRIGKGLGSPVVMVGLGCIDFDLWRGHTGGTTSGVVQPNAHSLLAASVGLEFCAPICSPKGHGWGGAKVVPAGGARQSAPGDAPRARAHVASLHAASLCTKC